MTRTATDKDGRFEITLAPGRYIVQALISGNDDAAEAALPPVDVIVP